MSETDAVTMQENSPEKMLAETPTVLVCAGDGGIEKGKAVLSLAEKEGVEERVKLIAINSGSGKFEGLDDDVETVALRTPDRRFHEHDVSVRPYLKDDHLGSGATGGIRKPRLGRYYFDNPERIGSYHDQIKRTIREFVERFQNDPEVDGPDGVNVFQLFGAGGGTGNGVTPLLTGLLYEVLENLTEDLHPGFEHWAVCSLATTSEFDRGGEAPDVHWRYPANSLALLDELRAITGYDDVEYPIRIPMFASRDRSDSLQSAYRIDENPFSGVFLLRFNQDEADNRAYSEGVGQTTARLVLDWMRKDQSEGDDLENAANALEDTFHELRGASFNVPTDQIEQLLAAKEQYQSAQQKVAEQSAEAAELSAAIEQLEAAIDAESVVQGGNTVSAADGEEALPNVMDTAFDRSMQTAGNISPATARVDGINKELGALQDRRSYSFHDRVDGDLVQRAVFLAAVSEEIHSTRQNHQFNTLVSDFVERKEDRVTKFDPSFDPTADPKEQYLGTIKPLLEELIQRLSSKIEAMGLKDRITNRSVYTSKKESLEQLQSTLTELESALEAHDHLADLAEAIEDDYESTVATLESKRETLATAKAEAESQCKTAKQQVEAAQKAIDRYKEELQNTPLGRFVTLPVASGVELQADQFSDNPGIASLIEDGILDPEEVVNRLQQSLYDHEDGVLGAALETRAEVRSPSQGRPIVFCTEETHDLVWDNAPTGTPPATIATDEFAKQPETVFCNNDQSIEILAIYSGLSLDNFDHGHIKDTLAEGRPMLWGEPIDLEDCYAYPEILPSSHPLSMRAQTENAVLPERRGNDD